MSNDPSTSLPPENKVIRKNPKVNISVVAAYERLERELKKLGVEIKPSGYNIEPAFGRHPFRIRNHNVAGANWLNRWSGPAAGSEFVTSSAGLVTSHLSCWWLLPARRRQSAGLAKNDNRTGR